MADIELINVIKIYGISLKKKKKLNKDLLEGKKAVNNVSIKIPTGSFTILVGPSGCGKTTLLRMIAGLEEITSGTIKIGDIDVTNLEPGDRGLAMVFQNYALYPHMTVKENIEFGLLNARIPKFEIKERVSESLKIVGLEEYQDRKPANLSGGQRQRVALARAISKTPQCFLMDEPLSNLDAKLRVQMRSEIIKITERLGITTIYVTHDQIEAMTMASRIVVMKDGYIQQVGTPKDIYDNPNNIFVGGFIGTPPMNFIEGMVTDDGYFEVGDHKLGVSRLKVNEKSMKILEENHFIEKPIIMGIRPEDIHDTPELFEKYKDSKVTLKVDVAELLGAETNIYAIMNGQNVVAKVDARVDIHMGDQIELAFNMEKVHFFDPQTELRIKRL